MIRRFILSVIILGFVIGCTSYYSSDHGYNVYIIEEADTTKYFYFDLTQDYRLFAKDEYKEVLKPETRQTISEKYIFGITDTKSQNCRLLIFRSPTGKSFNDYSEPLDQLLQYEFELDNYKSILVDEYIDSLPPISKHQIVALIENSTLDTLLIQENIISEEESHLNYTIITYRSSYQRDEMESILLDFIDHAEE